MQIENLTNPGVDPVEGDLIQIVHPSGATETKHYWEPVEIVDEVIHTWKITKLAFKNRFPRDKWKAARQASSVSADFYDFFESFELATHIDLELPETINSVTAMSAEVIPAEIRLTPEEVVAVINVPARPDEIPK